MSFNSLAFIGFASVSLLLYYIVPKRIRWFILLIASLSYYVIGCREKIVYVLYTALSVYLFSLVLGRLGEVKNKVQKEKNDRLIAKNRKLRKLMVLFCCLANFLLLYFLKYWNFTVALFSDIGNKLTFDNVVLPLGVSFFIFQSIGYIVDIYRGKYKPEKNFFKFLLFVCFFPQMVQGPISRFNELSPQLFEKRNLDYTDVKFGIQLIMWGYFKKLVVADRAAVIVNGIMEKQELFPGSIKAAAILFYCVQLYCDFSGGIDITLGLSRMFGIRLAENFKRPIFSKSLTEFWRRWHITLGSWMRDYVFYPISLSKPFMRLGKYTRKHFKSKLGKIIPTSLATFIIYFLIGIWHGANFRYIAFGFWNGILITSALLLSPVFAKLKKALKINDDAFWYRAFCILRTSFIVFIGRYITRAPRLMIAGSMIKQTFLDFQASRLFDGTLLSFGLSISDIIVVFIGIVIILSVECYQECGHNVRETLEKKSVFVQWVAIVIPLVILLVFGILRSEYISSSFIYQAY